MRVGLVDVDSHNFPNLVLMKLSAWHKSHGNEVELLRPADVLNGSNLFYGYDLMIGACVFDWNKPIADRLGKLGVIIGGTGSGNKDVLPEEPAAQDPAWYGTDDPDDEYYAEEAEEAEEETWYGYGEPSGFDDAANLTGEGPAPDAGGVVSENNVEEGVEITDDSADTGLPQNITLPDGTTVEIPQDCPKLQETSELLKNPR